MKAGRRSIALLCIGLNLGQGAAPLFAHADPRPPVNENPFTQIPGPVFPSGPRPVICASTPVRPTPLMPPQAQDPLECVDPHPVPAVQLGPFERQVEDYIRAYYSGDSLRTRQQSRLATQVFEHPGTPEYISRLQYIDHQGSRAPEAMYDLARALQNRWEAAYGMELNQRIRSGQSAPTNTRASTLGERRNDRVHLSESAGAAIGSAIALTALGIAALRNPTAVPRYLAVFRAALPAVGFVGGALLGNNVGAAINSSGVIERNLPVAPAHVMRLGIERDDFTQSDETLVRTLVPLVLSIGAGEAVYAAVEGERLATTLFAAVRAIRTAGLAASAAEVEFPPGLIATVIVTILVDKLATAAIDHWHYDNLRESVIGARNIVNYGLTANDNVTVYRGADALVLSTLNMATYINKPVFEANDEFLQAVAQASRDHAIGSPEYNEAIRGQTAELGTKVRAALADMDQGSDADYEAYLALGALEHQSASALDELSDVARHRAAAYIEAYRTYHQGFAGYLAHIEETRQANLGERARADVRDEYFRQYVREMRAAKDRELTASFNTGRIPRHAGHVLLQASALLRATGRDYVTAQADFLMAEVARNENLIRATLAAAPELGLGYVGPAVPSTFDENAARPGRIY